MYLVTDVRHIINLLMQSYRPPNMPYQDSSHLELGGSNPNPNISALYAFPHSQTHAYQASTALGKEQFPKSFYHKNWGNQPRPTTKSPLGGGGQSSKATNNYSSKDYGATDLLRKHSQDRTFNFKPSKDYNPRSSEGLNAMENSPYVHHFRRSESIAAKTNKADTSKDKDQDFRSIALTHRQSTDYKLPTDSRNKSNQFQTVQPNTWLQKDRLPSASKDQTFNFDFLKGQDLSTSHLNQKGQYFKPFDPFKSNSSALKEVESKPNQAVSPEIYEKPLQFKGVNLGQENSKKQYAGLGTNKTEYCKNIMHLDKDSESLKKGDRQSKDLIEKDYTKNSYINKLVQQSASPSEGTNEWYKNELTNFKKIESTQELPAPKPEPTTLVSSRVVELERQLESKLKEVANKNKQIWDKSKIIIDKNKTIDNLAAELRTNKKLLQSKETTFNERIAQLEETLVAKETDTNDKTLQRLVQMEKAVQQASKKQQEKTKEVNSLQIKVQDLQNRLEQITEEKTMLQRLNKQLKEAQSLATIEHHELKSALIAQQKRIMVLEAELDTSINSKKQSTATSKQNSISVQKRTSIVEEPKQKSWKGNNLQKELAELVLDCSDYQHQTIITKVRQLLDNRKEMEQIKLKEQQKAEEHHLIRVHHDFLEKKCQDMGKELKRATNKLAGVSTEAHHGWRLLHQSNQQIVALNLQALNQKYSQFFSQQ